MDERLNLGVLKLHLMAVSCLLFITAASVCARLPAPVASASEPFETRCGWFENPTPANIWLYDRDGEWMIGAQGGYQVPEDWDWPKFGARQWMKTNGSYGYGCACLQFRVDRASRNVLAIKSARARPLSACRQEPALKKRERLLRE